MEMALPLQMEDSLPSCSCRAQNPLLAYGIWYPSTRKRLKKTADHDIRPVGRMPRRPLPDINVFISFVLDECHRFPRRQLRPWCSFRLLHTLWLHLNLLSETCPIILYYFRIGVELDNYSGNIQLTTHNVAQPVGSIVVMVAPGTWGSFVAAARTGRYKSHLLPSALLGLLRVSRGKLGRAAVGAQSRLAWPLPLPVVPQGF